MAATTTTTIPVAPPSVTLNSGHVMPTLGFGTWSGTTAPAEMKALVEAVELALLAGYRSIDCAEGYQNEGAIGDVIKRHLVTSHSEVNEAKAMVERKSLFITSKVWCTHFSPENIRKSAQQSIDNLKCGYLDLYLLHWPVALNEPIVVDGKINFAKIPMYQTWAAMEKLVDDGLVKSIGISNFTMPSIADLLTYARIKPAVNQIELHPYLSQQNLLTYMSDQKIHATAYSPLGRPGQHKLVPLLDDPVIIALAKKYNVAPAVIVLRWAIVRGTSAVPKSANGERLKENLKALSVSITSDDIAALTALNCDRRYVNIRLYGGEFAFGSAGASIYE